MICLFFLLSDYMCVEYLSIFLLVFIRVILYGILTCAYHLLYGRADNVEGLGADPWARFRRQRDYLRGLRLVLRHAEADIVDLADAYCI
jgi:hypothetical protein